jgi:dihydrofolate reductase
MGRRTYEIFAKQWPETPGDYAAALNAIPKFVFSSTLEHAQWNNTTVIRGDVVAGVADLKAEPGPDLLMYGHGPLGQALIDAGLVDELTLNFVPVFVDGDPFFRSAPAATTWELLDAGRGSDPGLASLRYRFAGRRLTPSGAVVRRVSARENPTATAEHGQQSVEIGDRFRTDYDVLEQAIARDSGDDVGSVKE